MADVLQFSCPCCGDPLSLPRAAAGVQGPCPRCGKSIIGPDPERHQSARPAEPPATGQAPLSQLPVEAPLSPPLEPAPSTATVESPAAAEAAPGPPPFADFDPPPPGEASQPVAAPHPVAKPGISTAVFLLSCTLCSVLAFAGGYLVATQTNTTAGPFRSATAPSGDKTETGQLIPAKIPLQSWLPPTDTQTADEVTRKPGDGPEETLRAFLDAPGWAARSAYVLSPERVRETMAVHATTYGDGPIVCNGIKLLQNHDHTWIFSIQTQAMPSDFPAAVAKSGDDWLVDWEAFMEFHDDRFRSFADGPGEMHGVFRLLVNDVQPDPPGAAIAHYHLNPPMPGRERIAAVQQGSTAHCKLREIFETQRQTNPESYQELIAGKGLPLIVALSTEASPDADPAIRIEDVIAVGWAPQLDQAAP